MDYTNQQTLLQGLQNGETAAFEYLKEKYYEPIVNSCCLPPYRKEDKEDLYSDGIEILLKIINKPDFVLKSKLKTYFCAICKNIVNDKHDKDKARQNYQYELDDECYNANMEEEIDNSLFKKILGDNLKKLKKDCQVIFNKLLKDLSADKIAEQLGITIVNVRKRKSLCKQALYAQIEKDPTYISLRNKKEIRLTMGSSF